MLWIESDKLIGFNPSLGIAFDKLIECNLILLIASDKLIFACKALKRLQIRLLESGL